MDETIIRKLKRRAALHGVSAEEEHRRILKESLSRAGSRKPTLLEFLLSDDGVVHPEVELDLTRSREIETHREVVL